MTNKKAYQKAIHLWGQNFILDMLAEECVELVKAMFDFKRRKEGSFTKLLEELGDVEIMIEQTKMLLCIGTDKYEYTRIKRAKLKNFRKRVKGDPNAEREE